MIDLAILDWFLLEGRPVRAEEPVVKVDGSLADEVIPEKIVVVPALNLERGCAWETSRECEHFVDLWICFVKLVVIPVVVDFLATFDDHVRITE